MEYQREKEILNFAATWMKLKGIMRSKTSQAQKDKYNILYGIPYRWNLKKPNW